MLRTCLSLLIALLSLYPTTPALAEQVYAVVAARGMNEAELVSFFGSTQNLLLKANAGDSIHAYDGGSQRRVCTIVRSDGPPRAVLNAARRELVALRQYFSQSEQNGSARPLNIPAFATSVLSGLRADERPLRVLVFGPTSHTDGRDIGATFGAGMYPSDACALRSGHEHPFGTADRKGSLSNVWIDWCYFDDDCGTLERRAMVRWWKVWYEELGATLVSCQATPNVAIESAVRANTTPVTNDVIDRTATSVGVLQVRQAQANALPTSTPAAVADLATVASSVATTPVTGVVTVHAVWTSADGQADCDLWVRPAPDKAELNFSASQSPEGRLLRDVLRSGNRNETNWTASWEAVELRRGSVGHLSCYVNLYRNSGARVDGLVRLRIDDRTIDVPFMFSSGAGDSAGGRDQRDRSGAWVRIDLDRYLSPLTP